MFTITYGNVHVGTITHIRAKDQHRLDYGDTDRPDFAVQIPDRAEAQVLCDLIWEAESRTATPRLPQIVPYLPRKV